MRRESELVITTPYLVPDDALILALRGAAARGVKVSIILPEKVDSFLTRYASRSYYDELLDIGVEILSLSRRACCTRSRSPPIAQSRCSERSISTCAACGSITRSRCSSMTSSSRTALLDLQEVYIAQSDLLDPAAWAARPFRQRFIDNTLRLASPLL